MMGFHEANARLSTVVTSSIGVSAIYTPTGGSPIELMAVLIPGGNLNDSQWRTALSATMVAIIRKADLDSWSPGDTLQAYGLTWSLKSSLMESDAHWRLEFHRDLHPTFRR